VTEMTGGVWNAAQLSARRASARAGSLSRPAAFLDPYLPHRPLPRLGLTTNSLFHSSACLPGFGAPERVFRDFLSRRLNDY
jgi:hypothetical protein